MRLNIFNPVTCLFFVLTLSLTSCAQEKVLSKSEIPTEITTYVASHFPEHTIMQAIKDRDGITTTYDVMLSDQIGLEFNNKKEVIEINSKTQLPNSVIPMKILHYVTDNFPSNFITDWEVDDNKQNIELNSGLELEFNKKGDFLKLDD